MPEPDSAASLWERLRKARVFQTLAIYIPTGWVLIEILTAVTNNFSLPQSVPGIALMVFIAGLPVVAYLAWALQWTKRGIIIERKGWRDGLALAGIVGLALAIGGGMLVNLQDKRPRAESLSRPGGATTEAIASVAVLPFESTGALGTAFAGEIAGRLALHPDLFVVSPSAIVSARLASMAPFDLRGKLRTYKLVKGSIGADDNGNLLRLELVDANEKVQWRENFRFGHDPQSRNGVERRASQRIAEIIGTRYPVQDYCDASDSLDALEAYHRANVKLHQRGPENLAEAEGLLKKAIEIDPGYGYAYQSLAITYLLQRKPGNLALAVDVSRKALDHCEKLGAAYKIWVPEYRSVHNSWINDELQWQDALAMEPNNLWLLDNYATNLARTGRIDVARTVLERSYRNNPLEPRAILSYAWSLFDRQRADRILELAQRAEELGDKSCNSQMLRIRVAIQLRQDEDLASRALDDLPQRCRSMVPGGDDTLRMSIDARRDPGARRKFLDLLRDNIDREPNQAMTGAIELADLDLAFDAIEIGLRDNRFLLLDAWWAQTPEAVAFRRDPRFAALVKKLGLVEYWKEVGWPAGMCAPFGDSFVCDG